MNSLPASLSPVVIFNMLPYRENRYLQVLRNTVGLNSYQGLFGLCKIFFGLHIFTTTAQILARSLANYFRQ